MSREEAAEWLQDYGKAMVAEYIEAGDPGLDERWARFEKLLSSPLHPDDLK